MPDNIDGIAAVNHWRGQCLDNFARVEHAIINVIERWLELDPKTAPALAETASARTRNLGSALKKHQSGDTKAKQLVKLLELWRLREAQRNELVHGVFKVKSGADGWTLINLTRTVKKQVSRSREYILSANEAAAFLTAIVRERKALETALSEISM
ncbi:hypothetical protein [Qipengyuania aquimaris]|uniref:Uncharacterized protein n=1 Tax=Qipengyuania aquimaris TaxID=255984 RepID=A0A9Q3S353_9SPHN|nr:hypothetical protein [Qipengyuania aquimaris]MBY6219093.1 hypothetical protein [Qipengyuania aquimaris]